MADVGEWRNTRNFVRTSNCLNYLSYELSFFIIFAILQKTYLSQMLKYPVGKRYCQQFWSSSVWKTFSLCFSEEMWPCHCFSLLQFFPHIQQWKSTCFTRNLKTKHCKFNAVRTELLLIHFECFLYVGQQVIAYLNRHNYLNNHLKFIVSTGFRRTDAQCQLHLV